MRTPDRMPELIVLGSGAFNPDGDPRRVRNPSGYAVKIGRRILLFDLGFGNIRQLARAGLDYADISDIFLSHCHPDHVGDLAALFFLLRCDRRPKSGVLRIFGPPGTRSFVKKLGRAYHPWLGPKGYRLVVKELKPGRGGKGPDWFCQSREARHGTPALSFRLSVGAKSFVYSGDTGWDPGLADFAKACDLLLLECSLGGKEKMDRHLNARQAVALALISGAKRTLLTHLTSESAAAARRLIKRERRISLAEDLMRVRL